MPELYQKEKGRSTYSSGGGWKKVEGRAENGKRKLGKEEVEQWSGQEVFAKLCTLGLLLPAFLTDANIFSDANGKKITSEIDPEKPNQGGAERAQAEARQRQSSAAI
jgi:hypothetical protein